VSGTITLNDRFSMDGYVGDDDDGYSHAEIRIESNQTVTIIGNGAVLDYGSSSVKSHKGYFFFVFIGSSLTLESITLEGATHGAIIN
jgi:hypothetical protein